MEGELDVIQCSIDKIHALYVRYHTSGCRHLNTLDILYIHDNQEPDCSRSRSMELKAKRRNIKDKGDSRYAQSVRELPKENET